MDHKPLITSQNNPIDPEVEAWTDNSTNITGILNAINIIESKIVQMKFKREKWRKKKKNFRKDIRNSLKNAANCHQFWKPINLRRIWKWRNNVTTPTIHNNLHIKNMSMVFKSKKTYQNFIKIEEYLRFGDILITQHFIWKRCCINAKSLKREN